MARPSDRRRPATLAPGVLAEVGLADLYARFDSPIGPLVVAWNGLGVSAVEAAADDAAFEAAHLARTGRRAFAVGPPARSGSDRRSPGGSSGDRRVRIDLDLRGHTDFERDVWLKALEIPRGEVRPYGWVAAEIGRPKAVRAVGTALGHNPVPLIVPVPPRRPDGRHDRPVLAGRAGEQADDPAPRRAWTCRGWRGSPRRGIRFVGSDTTKIFCLPTCRHARRVTDRHRLRVPLDGRGPGARLPACLVCRPASAAACAPEAACGTLDT